MKRMIFLMALLAGAAAPVAAQSTDQSKQREAENWDVLFSKYPAGSLARGEQGLVGFKVSLDRDGYATTCEVTHTSGHSTLDSETCRLMLLNADFKGIRDGNGRKVSSVHEGVVNWKLPTTARDAVPAAPLVIAKAAVPEKLVCKRKLKTGSLADFERICFTQSQWQQLARETKDVWGEMQGSKGSTRE